MADELEAITCKTCISFNRATDYSVNCSAKMSKPTQGIHQAENCDSYEVNKRLEGKE